MRYYEMDYKGYKTEDFVLDQRFRNWILYPDNESNAFWTKWIENNPDKRDCLREARLIVLQYPEVRFPLSDRRVEQLWQNIEEAISASEGREECEKEVISLNPQSVIYTRRSRRLLHPGTGYFLKVAAILVIMLISTLLLYYHEDLTSQSHRPELVVKRNPWGQKSTIYLNDGSEVILNSGSTLEYNKYFEEGKRVLVLKGEAYFKVYRDPERPFTVISDGLTTTALGTEFNIRAYPAEKLQISLISGSVEVQNDEKKWRATLLPGEGVVRNMEDKSLSRVEFDKDEVLDWRNGILSFYDADQNQVIKRIEQWYGVTVTFFNQSKKEWVYSGKFYKQSLEEVLMSIGFAMDFSYKINKDTVTITYE